jgi:hypothetical protein
MRFAGIGYYDLSSFYTAYIGKHKASLVESPAPHHHKVRVLDLLNDREETEVLKGWKSAQALFQKVRTRLSELPKPGDLQHAHVLAYAPGAYTDWHQEDIIDPDAFMRVHVLLNPSPSFRLYSSEEMLAPLPWGATAVDHRGPVAASNFNAPNTAHELVLELALDVVG